MKVFFSTYRFLSCGNVFTDGYARAAESLGIEAQFSDWAAPNLPTLVERFNPDLLFVIHGRRFVQRWGAHHPAWKHRARAIQLVDEPYECDDTVRFAAGFPFVFVNDPITIPRHGGRATYLPVCYDSFCHIPGDQARIFSTGFIGGGNQTRDRILGALADRGLLSYVIGGRWNHPAVRKLCRALNIPALEATLWYQQTRIIVNVFRERHHYNKQGLPATTMNPRCYEALACGALVVSEWRPEIESVIPELPTFRTAEECVALVDAFTKDPEGAARVQALCRARIEGHTYAARLATVLQTCGVQQEAMSA